MLTRPRGSRRNLINDTIIHHFSTLPIQGKLATYVKINIDRFVFNINLEVRVLHVLRFYTVLLIAIEGHFRKSVDLAKTSKPSSSYHRTAFTLGIPAQRFVLTSCSKHQHESNTY